MRARSMMTLVILLAVPLAAPGQVRPDRRPVQPPGPPVPAAPAPVLPPDQPALPCPPPASTAPPSQPTHLRVEAFQVSLPGERLPALDPAGLRPKGPGEVARRLGEFGTARLVVRFDTVVNLRTSTSITSGRRLPSVRDVTLTKDGKATPSVTYQEVGAILEISGTWRDGGGVIADATVSFELSSIGKTGIEAAAGVNLPSYDQLKIRQQMVLESGRPTLTLVSPMPEPNDAGKEAVVTLLSLTATRLELGGAGTQTRPAEEASAGGRTVIHAALFELRTEEADTDWRNVERRLNTEATMDAAMSTLRQHGEAELLSRPSMLVDWPGEASIRVGERVPVVRDIQQKPDGTTEPQIDYADVGVNLKVGGRWLSAARGGEAELDIAISHQAVSAGAVKVAPEVNLPVFSSPQTQRTIRVQEDRPVWLACTEGLLHGGEGQGGSIVFARLTVNRAR